MSKADVIEIEGKVIEKLPNTCSISSYKWKTSHELH